MAGLLSVPNCAITQIQLSEDRQGRKCEIPNLSRAQSVKTLRNNSFQVQGPKLFNALPSYIRNITKCGVKDFKDRLDNFLPKIPDSPKIGHLM